MQDPVVSAQNRTSNGLERPLVIVGDVHLTHGGTPDTALALARLIERHPGHEIVLNGDVWNLSLDPPGRDPIESAVAMVRPYPELGRALSGHLAAGGRVAIISGNHDSDLATPGMRDALLGLYELGRDAPLSIVPWLVRRGGVHVEHGHVYDPDNAPTHPLVRPSHETEPLGVALTRRFLAPNQAFDFAHATEITPVEALLRAYRVFGSRMPLLLARYFTEAGRYALDARWRKELLDEKRTGDALFGRAAGDIGLSEETLRAIEEDRPRPTHESFDQVFFRLYFDRVAATLGLASGALFGAIFLSPAAAAAGVASGLYLRESVRRGRNRYAALPVRRLRDAAERVRALSGAELVVFGHTHVPEKTAHYLNPGSFTYRGGPGRPYAYVDTEGRGERRELEQ